MNILISLLMAIMPAIILVIYFYKQDRAKAEPKKLVLKIFFLGILSTIPAIILELIVSQFKGFIAFSPILYFAFDAFIVAAFCEEFIKLSLVKRFAFNKTAFDEIMDGILYTIIASLGFACMENILYVLNNGLSVAILRAFTAVPMHALCSGIMGYYIGKAKFSKSKSSQRDLFKRGLIIAIAIHGLYNFLIFIGSIYGYLISLGILPLLILSFLYLRKLIRKSIKEDIDQHHGGIGIVTKLKD